MYETADIRTGEAIRTRQTSPKSNYRETSYIGVFTSCIVDANWYRLIFTFGGYLRWYRVVNVRILMSDSLHVLDHHAFRAVYRPHRAHCWKENRVCPLTINRNMLIMSESHFCFRINKFLFISFSCLWIILLKKLNSYEYMDYLIYEGENFVFKS